MTVFEILKGLPKAKYASTAEGTKKDRHGIEFAPAAKVVKRKRPQGETPGFSLRPIQDDAALLDTGKDVLLNIVPPMRAVRVHKQDIATARVPSGPDGDTQASRIDHVEWNGQQEDSQRHGQQEDQQRWLPPGHPMFRFGVVHRMRLEIFNPINHICARAALVQERQGTDDLTDLDFFRWTIRAARMGCTGHR